MTDTTAAVRTYTIDKSHSEATFQIRHLVTKVRGRFSDFEGTIRINEASPDLSSVEFTIQAASIDTNEKDRDAHLRSADFFDIEKYPTITFRSAQIVKKGSEIFDVIGDLTIRDVTTEATLPVTHLGTVRDPWGKEKIGFEAETTINRKDYGLTWNAVLETGGLLVGDDVRITLSIQAFRE